jgi:sulfotransferase
MLTEKCKEKDKTMDKQYFFLAGLHRSGNTVLSAILNQNEKIYCSSLGPLLSSLHYLHRAKVYEGIGLMSKDEHRINNLISNTIKNYYYDVDKPIIIDRDKGWATPRSIGILKEYITPNPKIIFTTRPILEVLASYISVAGNQVQEWMRDPAMSNGYKIDKSLGLIDNMCDFLMCEGGQLRHTLNALHAIDNPEHRNNIHIVKYQDLLSYPQKTMNGIYDFLEIEKFNHDFSNIESKDDYNYEVVGLPKNLHYVRSNLSRSSVRVKGYLTPYVIDKYKDYRYY